MKKDPPAPPYSSGISIPMIPSSKNSFSRSLWNAPSSSIFLAKGFRRASAKSLTVERNSASSSENEVTGGRAEIFSFMALVDIGSIL